MRTPDAPLSALIALVKFALALFAAAGLATTPAVATLCTLPSAASQPRAPQDPIDPAQLPCVPLWVRDGAPSPFVGAVIGSGAADAGDETRAETGDATAFETAPQRVRYESLIDFTTTGDVFAAYRDPSAAGSLTLVFCGDYNHDRVVMHTIDPSLAHAAIPLPISYGMAWLAADLDRDGALELVLQRGDPGMGGNGYLDIHSAPDWRWRARIVLSGMKVYFYPEAIDVDDDPYLELYLTPSSLAGSARAMLVDYNPVTDSFILTDNLVAPNLTGGETAAGDFDGDGRVEFLTGHAGGYALFEYAGGALHSRGAVAGIPRGAAGSAVRPFPDGVLHALLGHSSFELGYRYYLLRATGDNTFTTVHVFQEMTGYAGIMPNLGLDADRDGRDEIVMEFHPHSRVFEWHEEAGAFHEIWSWDEAMLGTFIHWKSVDCDQDHVPEWCTINHEYVFRAFEDQDVDPSAAAEPAIADRAASRRAFNLRTWPNPSRGGVSISWTPAEQAPASCDIRICDAAGRVVRDLYPANGTAAGSLTWDGRDESGSRLPAGRYWLRARGVGQDVVGPVTIVR